MDLSAYTNGDFNRGRPVAVELAWVFVSGGLIESWIPGSAWRVWLLRMFGARIGRNATFKPRVKIKFPWKLVVGDHVWIGEKVWIDNLAVVTIGSNVCLSQGVYLCTGNHDWSRSTFDLIVAPIEINSRVWIGAFCLLGPGSVIEEGAVVSFGSRVTGRVAAQAIHAMDGSLIEVKARHEKQTCENGG